MIEDGSQHYLNSVLRESIVEHLFIGEALRQLWLRGITDTEILRSEFDAGGYDLVVSRQDITRHIQFKTVTLGGKAANVKVSMNLMHKPSGCVIWMVVLPDLRVDHYLWFGSRPRQSLPDISAFSVARHTKGNAEGEKLKRPNHRIVPKGKFERLGTMEDVLVHLLGPL